MSSTDTTADPNEALAWRRWLLVLVGMTAAVTLLLLGLIVVIDPYSTGRLTFIKRLDFVTGNRLYDSAARVRDPSFNSAIIGNSHGVRISSVALDQSTGRHFVTLAIEGTWPYEHTFLMRAFERHHRAPTFVAVLDETWCSPTPEKAYVVPRWLHEGSNLTYLSNILSPFSARMAWRRLLIMSGRAAGQPPNGYDPRPWMPAGRDRMRHYMETMAPPTEGPDVNAPMPFFDELQRTLGSLGTDANILFVYTPVFAKQLPAPGSRAEARLNACKARANAIVRSRPRTALLDLMVYGPKVADIDNFTDITHFRGPLAQDVDAAIGQRLNEMLRTAAR